MDYLSRVGQANAVLELALLAEWRAACPWRGERSMERLEIQTRILRALNDATTAPIYWTVREIQDYIQEGQEVLAESVPFVKRSFLTPRRAGTLVYQLPGVGTDILAPYRIWLPDLKRRLVAATMANLDGRHERWMGVTGQPWWWVPVNWDSFLIWPPPATGEGWLEVNCYCWPTAMRADADAPELHPSSAEALVIYGTALGKLKQWLAQDYLQTLGAFFGSAGHVRAQEGVNQVQERFFGREMARGEDTAPQSR